MGLGACLAAVRQGLRPTNNYTMKPDENRERKEEEER